MTFKIIGLKIIGLNTNTANIR